MGLTATLCERIASLGYDDMPEAALAAARRLVLDGLAVGVAGVSEEDAIPIMARVVKELGGTPVATAIGCGFRTDPVRAAAINGAAMHVLDFEPMWSPATHALSVTLPVALALAEARGLSGREVLAALVKGLEIQGWLREASGQYTPDVLQFHPPGLVGPMGAVVVASHLMKLDPLRIANAFGIAGSRAGSLFGNVGTMTKSAHCGQAASMGLESALLAEAGFTGDTETFESPLGYANSFYKGTFKPDEMLHYGRAPWRLAEPGYAIKMFPSQFGTHFGITAGLELHKRVTDASAIKAVTLTGPVMPYVNRPFPETGLSGKFSLQYTMASALLDGKVGIHTFTEQKLHRPEMQSLLGKITLEMDKSIPARFETMHVHLHVELNDGTVLETTCNGPRGMWGQSAIADADHLVKVRDCLGTKLSAGAVEKVIGLGSRIDTLAPAQVGEMMGLVG